MAITQTGTNLDFPVNSSAQSGTVSSTITVPSDAQIVIVGVSNYHNVTNGHITMTFTKGGVDTAMSREGGGDNVRNWETTLFWLVSPDTGANKTLKWSWTSSTPDANQVFSVTFWKGIDTASPVRSSAGNNGLRWPRNTPLLTAQDGDRIVAFSGFYYGPGGGVGEVSTWNNLIEVAECANQGYAEGAWASTTDIITPAVYSPLVPFALGTDVPGMSHRLRCPTTSGGSQVRVTFSAVDTGWNTRHCSVGIAATNTSTVATPVELKFGGASGFSLTGYTTITSDWTDLPFTAGQALVVIMDHGASPARFSYWTGNISTFPSPVGTAHSWLAATQSWNNSSDAGFNQVNEDAVGVLSVESNGSTGNLSVGVAYSTGSEGGIAALVLKPATAVAATGTGALNATISGLAALGSGASFGAATLAGQTPVLTSIGVARWTATGVLSPSGASVVSPGLTGSVVTGAALQASFAGLIGIEGVSNIAGTGSLPSQSSGLSGSGTIVIVSKGTGALSSLPGALAGAGLSRSTGDANLTARASVISGAGIGIGGLIKGTGELVASAGAVTGTDGIKQWLPGNLPPSYPGTAGFNAGTAAWINPGTRGWWNPGTSVPPWPQQTPRPAKSAP